MNPPEQRLSRPLGPPAALFLVHGAGSGPWVFSDWPASFPDLPIHAVDLHQGLDVACASHGDYLASLERTVTALPAPVSVCGWSMGGLVALQVAARQSLHSVIVLEPSPPLETQGANLDIRPCQGTFDPEEVYGLFPPGMRARPESALARAERRRGISVPSLSCPSLVVYGDQYHEKRGTSIASHYGATELYFPGLDHWGLVRNDRVRESIAVYLGAKPPRRDGA